MTDREINVCTSGDVPRYMAFWCKEHAGLNTLRALVTIPRLATKEYGFLGFWILFKTKVKPTGYKYIYDVRHRNIVI